MSSDERGQVAPSEVTASDGTRLRVYESGKPDATTVLCVHGYPDEHTVWDGVAAELADRYRVLRYDVRGAGKSDTPHSREAYRMDQLADDLITVIDAVSPGKPVHLLGHDWGSIQSWHAVTANRHGSRIASFTSISGPCLDHAGYWFATRLRNPSLRGIRELLRQLASSWYLAFFQLPVVPELLWRSGLGGRVLSLLNPRAPSRVDPADAVAGLALYRANMPARLSRPAPGDSDVPVLVLAPRGDLFVSAPLQTDVGRWVSNLRVRTCAGGHWLPRDRPREVADHVRQLIEDTESAQGGH